MSHQMNWCFALIAISAISSASERLPVQDEVVPPGWKEVPFVETAPPFKRSAEEMKNGMMLFSRPLTAPVYPQSRPRMHERITSLDTFGAGGETVVLNFSLYPDRELKNLKVSAEKTPFQHELRQMAYWKVRYPLYTTKGTYRRVGEYLFPATSCDVPAREPQRFVLTLNIPKGTKGGAYNGLLRITYDGLNKPVKLPYTVQVLPFDLKSDPDKHYSAYNYALTQRGLRYYRTIKNDPEWIKKAVVQEFRRMKEYGFTRPPFMHMRYNPANGGFYEVPHLDELLSQMKQAGLDTPVLMIGGCGEGALYHKFTGRQLGKHGHFTVTPPEEMYREIERLLKKFKQECKDKNYPEIIFGPVDEPSPATLEMVRRIYKIFKDAGFRTFVTSCPFEKEMRDVVDFWSDQPFRPLKEVAAKDKKEYWCYPNHNAYEIKDPVTMARGGRMTYGFGFYRSGYTLMIPWIWREYYDTLIDPARPGGGNRMTEKGDVAMTTYWECFRQGITDGRYLYTLIEAISSREKSADPKCRAAVAQAKQFLKQLWKSIPWRSKYLADNHWNDESFDGWRAAIAKEIASLVRYRASNPPSEAEAYLPYTSEFEENDFVALRRREQARGNLTAMPLGPDVWRAVEKEASLVAEADHVAHLAIKVDQKIDGSGTKDNRYPSNWPRMRFAPKTPLDLTKYDFLAFRLRVDSNRDGETAIHWPLHLDVISAIGPKTRAFPISSRLEPGSYRDFIIPVQELMKSFSFSEEQAKKIAAMQVFISESNYRHDDDLHFRFGDMALIGLKNPVIGVLDTASIRRLPVHSLPWRVSILGRAGKDRMLQVTLRDARKKVIASGEYALGEGEMYGALMLPELSPGLYHMTAEIKEKQKVLSSVGHAVRLLSLP